MRITCTCVVQRTFVTHDSHRIAREQDCLGAVKRGLTVLSSLAVFLSKLRVLSHMQPLPDVALVTAVIKASLSFFPSYLLSVVVFKVSYG